MITFDTKMMLKRQTPLGQNKINKRTVGDEEKNIFPSDLINTNAINFPPGLN